MPLKWYIIIAGAVYSYKCAFVCQKQFKLNDILVFF